MLPAALRQYSKHPEAATLNDQIGRFRNELCPALDADLVEFSLIS